MLQGGIYFTERWRVLSSSPTTLFNLKLLLDAYYSISAKYTYIQLNSLELVGNRIHFIYITNEFRGNNMANTSLRATALCGAAGGGRQGGGGGGVQQVTKPDVSIKVLVIY